MQNLEWYLADLKSTGKNTIETVEKSLTDMFIRLVRIYPCLLIRRLGYKRVYVPHRKAAHAPYIYQAKRGKGKVEAWFDKKKHIKIFSSSVLSLFFSRGLIKY